MPAPAIIAVAATVAATGYSIYSQQQQGKQQQALANYNAQLDEQQAQATERDAAIAANEKRRENTLALSNQRALYAKAGVVGTTDSPLMIQAQSAAMLERNASAIDVAGQNQAAALDEQSILQRFAGASARRTATMNSIGTGLEGLSRAASQSYGYWGK